MEAPRTIVLVGGGLAAVSAAENLRRIGFDGRLILVSGEPHVPYDRPPLSKAFLSGSVQEAPLLRDAEFFSTERVEMVYGQAASIDLHQRRVCLEKGGSISFDRLLLSTGSRPRQLRAPFAAVSSLYYLQSLDDAKRLKTRLKAGAKVVVIGGGYVGLEVASTASELGCSVVVIDQASRLLQRSVIPEVSEHMLQLHRSKGVVVKLGVTISRLEQSADGCRLHLSDETVVDANTVVVGIGSVPNTELAEAIGLHVEDGIRVDPSMRSTNPAIFAAGDVASHWNGIHDRQVRLESWQNAARQGAIAAKAMLGQEASYCETPWFWTDQFGTNVQIVGVPASHDKVVIRGRREDNRFSILQLSEGRIVGALLVNDGRNVRPVREAIDRKAEVDTQLLADADVPLRNLLAAQAA
ncbi:FAD-dependent oxidoreductase [Bradyrhizobium sp. CCGB12]|uniref:NAD(P)/FAD-dependent oxidoreductase n=1 Tax=Bradyrhizobium sp. CCGB12 TaxID=2949632 RepID=UPI0020B3A769|nr:FAD-dependent oxidoreductase [Bradyrhizobium sp. CCGB12]MCP3387799.1 FAD-dependent oxidoreductase [Bradyrhizobium sp. CCGB12]